VGVATGDIIDVIVVLGEATGLAVVVGLIEFVAMGEVAVLIELEGMIDDVGFIGGKAEKLGGTVETEGSIELVGGMTETEDSIDLLGTAKVVQYNQINNQTNTYQHKFH
jgi:hypothetical protein